MGRGMSKGMRWLVPLVLASCVESAEPDEPEALPRGLTMEDDGELLVGSYVDDELVMRFVAEVTDGGFEVEVVFNGMTIRATKDDSGVLEHDGFATDNGEPTQMTDDDREALVRLTAVLEEQGAQVSPPLQRLRGFANVWSEYPSTLDLRGTVANFRAYTSICEYYGTFQEATHDDWSYDRWDDASTYFAYVSMHGPGPCSGGTYFWNNDQWECFEPDHSTSIEYAYGECFGRCGAGCGSSSQFTWDCLDHDSCVRFGHSLASLWCNDEFSSTVDDWASAPNCL
ncbi:MAG: hypothetical protein AB1Z98_10520 [Nannocystaceae bacterium]